MLNGGIHRTWTPNSPIRSESTLWQTNGLNKIDNNNGFSAFQTWPLSVDRAWVHVTRQIQPTHHPSPPPAISDHINLAPLTTKTHLSLQPTSFSFTKFKIFQPWIWKPNFIEYSNRIGQWQVPFLITWNSQAEWWVYHPRDSNWDLKNHFFFFLLFLLKIIDVYYSYPFKN